MADGLVAMGHPGVLVVGCMMRGFGLLLLFVMLSSKIIGIWQHAGKHENHGRYYDAALLLVAMWCLS